MPQSRAIQCTNCGTTWAAAERPLEPGGAEVCPVCQLAVSPGEASARRVSSVSDLVSQLGALIGSARAGGVDDELIVQALRDELEFAAEMAHAGRHFCVQLIDLGPQAGDILQRPVHDRREMLQTRSVN